MNLQQHSPSTIDKDTAWDLAQRAWTAEHRLGGWHMVPLTDTAPGSVTDGNP